MGWNDPKFWDKVSDKYGGWVGASGMTKPHQDEKRAEAGLDRETAAYDSMSAPDLQRISPQTVGTEQATASMQGPTAFDGIRTDPSLVSAQRDQLAALSNLAKNGGRNAASDANLAQIQQAANANAQGQRGAIMQNARARGMGGSGNALLAQLSSAQNATNNQSAQDMMVRGQDQNMALQAGQGAAQIGANMQQQQYGEQAQRAAAADAIARFNAGNTTQNSQFNAGQRNSMGQTNANRDFAGQEYNSGLGQTEFGDRMGVAKGQADAGAATTKYWDDKYKQHSKANNETIKGAGEAIMSMFAAGGGRVPGVAPVHGDSLTNDIVPVNTSPGEVIVPRTLAHAGSKDQIASFVKHPPVAGTNNKEAMLSALKNLRSRR